jgi:hypothetical protein
MNRDKQNVLCRSLKLSGRDHRSRECPADDVSGSACAGSAVCSNNDRIMARERRTCAGKSPDVTVRDNLCNFPQSDYQLHLALILFYLPECSDISPTSAIRHCVLRRRNT